MISCMIGSSLYGKYLSLSTIILYSCISFFFIAMLLTFYNHNFNYIIGVIIFIGLCIFEVSVGYYFPAISQLRSIIIPNHIKSIIINILRIPLNIIVILVFINLKRLGHLGSLVCCSMFLFISITQQNHYKRLEIS